MANITEVRTSKTPVLKTSTILLSAAFLALAASAVQAKGVFKYYIDGVVMYGDRVPAGATTDDGGHSVLSSQGTTLREVVKDSNGDVVPQEVEADREKPKQVEITEADLALLERYNSEEELIEEGDKGVYALDTIVYRYERRIEVLKRRADKVSKQMQAVLTAQGESAAKPLKKELNSLAKNIAAAQAMYDEKAQERFVVNAQVDKDLARYRELTYVPEDQQAELDE